MRILYIILFFAGLPLLGEAQFMSDFSPLKKSTYNDVIKKQKQKNLYPAKTKSNLREAAACGYDTIDYVFSKLRLDTTSGINFITAVDVPGNPTIIAEYFPCPQPITISGFFFYGISNHAVPVNVECSIYEATQDSLIFIKNNAVGLEKRLATMMVPVDTAGLNSHPFNGIRMALFDKPVVVSKPFIVAISNTSADPVILVTNDYSDTTLDGKQKLPDGFMEGLMSFTGQIENNNVTSYHSVDFGYDGDLLVSPFIKYDITSDFIVDKTTVSVGEDVTFTNLSSPIMNDYHYNTSILKGQKQYSYYWNFGDSTNNVPDLVNSFDSVLTKKYMNPGQYTVTLADSMYGYYQTCGSSKSVVITVQAPTQAVDKSFSSDGIRLFPNPNDGEFTVTFAQNMQDNYDVLLTDITGAEVQRYKVYGGNETRISLKDFPKGMYLLKMFNDKDIIVKQVIRN